MVDLLTDWLTYKDTRVQGYLFTSDINPFTTGVKLGECKAQWVWVHQRIALYKSYLLLLLLLLLLLSTFSAMRFDEIPFKCQYEKEDKKVKVLKFCTFIGRFQMTSWHNTFMTTNTV